MKLETLARYPYPIDLRASGDLVVCRLRSRQIARTAPPGCFGAYLPDPKRDGDVRASRQILPSD
jgi:hypothetical protein